MDCSLPGSSVHGIFQAGVLEWGAIAFSVDWIRLVVPKTQNQKIHILGSSEFYFVGLGLRISHF